MAGRIINPNVKTMTDVARELRKVKLSFKVLGRPQVPYIFDGAGTTADITVPAYVVDANYVTYQGGRTRIPKTDDTEDQGEFNKSTNKGYHYEQVEDSHGIYNTIRPVDASVFGSGRECVFWYYPAEL